MAEKLGQYIRILDTLSRPRTKVREHAVGLRNTISEVSH